MRPPGILRRRIFAVVRPVLAGGALASVPGGRKFRAWRGRCWLQDPAQPSKIVRGAVARR
jgi:hypothetical protein